MIDKTVNYLGLTLKNPIVVSSCGLTSNVESIKKLEKSGVAAVVLKSLFEEQIIGEAYHTSANNEMPEMESYVNAYVKDNNIGKYINLIKEAKEECSIPIIASICCNNDGDWVEFAKDIEQAGADALELNIFYMPSTIEETSAQIEANYIKTVQHVISGISIPVTVKIPNHFTNPLNVINELYYRGIKGVVMFNRFYEPDIDVDAMAINSSSIYSTKQDIHQAIRWIGVCSSKIKTISYGSSSGVHEKEDIIKMMLAGANVVHVCSVVYQKGHQIIGEMLEYIDYWAEKNTFTKISDIIGLLDYSHIEYGGIYERAQFMKYFSSHNN